VDVEGRTESETVAAQDQALQTKYHATKILCQHKTRHYKQNIMQQKNCASTRPGITNKISCNKKIVLVQDQSLQTKYHATKILQTETDSKCRLCQQSDETIDRIISACPVVEKEQYMKRHDRVCVELHFNTCKEIGV
jgi:uncharacterized protein YecT (DUF1311 family)